jgi:hypothetical protein
VLPVVRFVVQDRAKKDCAHGGKEAPHGQTSSEERSERQESVSDIAEKYMVEVYYYYQ